MFGARLATYIMCRAACGILGDQAGHNAQAARGNRLTNIPLHPELVRIALGGAALARAMRLRPQTLNASDYNYMRLRTVTPRRLGLSRVWAGEPRPGLLSAPGKRRRSGHATGRFEHGASHPRILLLGSSGIPRPQQRPQRIGSTAKGPQSVP